MAEAYEPAHQIPEILDILAQNIDAIDQNRYEPYTTEQHTKLTLLQESLKELNYYFLISPESITDNFKKYLLRIFQKPPTKEIMDECAKCIVTALKSKISNVIQPTDFSFNSIISHIRDGKYSDQTIINLLEIIFTISGKQSSQIANQKNDDIDIFFKFYDKFDLPSKISCLKCINNIVSNQVFTRFVIFLPNLLDIAKHSEYKSSEWEYSIQAFITISKSLNNSTILTPENFQPLEYCEKLCDFTSHYNDQETLNVFIDSIRVCVLSFNSMVQIVFKHINLAYYFESIEKVSILESVIKLTLSLMPPPDSSIIELYPSSEFRWLSSDLSIESVQQIEKVIPYICSLYFHNLSLSKLCIQALAVFINSKSFNFSISNQVIYMMHFNLNDPSFVPYILAIVQKCVNTKSSIEGILRSKLIERIMENAPRNCMYSRTVINSLQPVISNSPYMNSLKIEFNSIESFIDLIDRGQISPFDLFASYIQISKSAVNHFKTLRKIMKQQPDIDSNADSEKYQKLVDFFVRMLADLPLPITVSDPYYPDYFPLNDEEIEMKPEKSSLDSKTINLFSILSELTDHNADKKSIRDLLNGNPEVASVFDKSTLKHKNQYTYNCLYRELKKNVKGEQEFIVINNTKINDSDQFVLTILPQILNTVPDDQAKQIGSIDLKMRTEKSTQPHSKRDGLIFHTRFMKGGEICQEILDILNMIHDKDSIRSINFYYKPFVKGIERQKKFFFLSISLNSPYSQLMVKYPFLFGLKDRMFLFRLLTKEPIYSRDFFYKKLKKGFTGEKTYEPYSKIKFIIERENLFKQGLIILEKFGKYRSYLEVAFKGDDGFGAGTTSQFFDKMSREFCMKRHRLWRRDNHNDDSLYSSHEQGLFPYATANSRYMRVLGIFVAKAIQMEQIVDIPFNPAFFDVAAGRKIQLKDVDEQLAKSLYDPSWEACLCDYDDDEKYKPTFTIEIERRTFNLVKNGQNIFVNHDNFKKFITATENYICGKHVKAKIDHFVDGFAEVLDPSFLKMFSGEEMITILNGSKEKLTVDELSKYIVVDTGYDNNSIQVQYFKEIVADFDFEYQKYLIKYVTGSAFLPVGGLQELNPPITVARREAHDKKFKDEDCWPSARTCINKLFLPPYQSKEQMRENIVRAISDPMFRESFGLS